MNGCVQINKREFLKQLGIGSLGITSITTAATADDDIEEPSETLAVDTAVNEDRDVVAFTSDDDLSLCLFLATGTSDLDDEADEITQVTEPDKGSVWDIHWTDESTLQYWKNGGVHELTISSDGSVVDEDFIEEQPMPPGIEFSQSGISPSAVTPGPPGGGGDLPDWWDDDQYTSGPVDKCNSNGGVEVCTGTGTLSPKFFVDCYGNEIPLVGATFNTVSLSAGASGSFGLDLWIGVNPDTNCMYWGSDALDLCLSDCFSEFTLAEIENSFKQDLNDFIESEYFNIIAQIVGYTLAALAVIAAAAVLSSIGLGVVVGLGIAGAAA